jgi:starch phosphorylase
VLIGGKAAPGYFMAKRIITLINNVAQVVNKRSPGGASSCKVAFLPDYRVSAMESHLPGTDLSEQISTAGKEASGTGNMKFMMNGASPSARWTAPTSRSARRSATRTSSSSASPPITADPGLKRVMELLESGHFNRFEPGLFDPILSAIRSPRDPWLVAADFRAFVDAQARAAAAWRDPEAWTRMSILNSATSGKFSTDRTMREYAAEIWKLSPVAPAPR